MAWVFFVLDLYRHLFVSHFVLARLSSQGRGCPLLGLRSHPTLEAQEERFLSRGWSQARALDMNDVYRFFIPADDVMRYADIIYALLVFAPWS